MKVKCSFLRCVQKKSSFSLRYVKQSSFTQIGLPVAAERQDSLLKTKNDTSLRPSGRTSRLPQANSSHLHIFTSSAFRLIELLVCTTCQIGVLPLYYLKKENKKMP